MSSSSLRFFQFFMVKNESIIKIPNVTSETAEPIRLPGLNINPIKITVKEIMAVIVE